MCKANLKVLIFTVKLLLVIFSNAQNTCSYSNKIDSILCFAENYLGKPYRFRNIHNMTMDCSGFMNYIFSSRQIALPRSSRDIALVVEKVEYDSVQRGDLLFFKGRNISSPTIGHVAIVVEKNETSVKMLHSCRRGIIIEDFPTKYYSERFVFAGRLPEELFFDISEPEEL